MLCEREGRLQQDFSEAWVESHGDTTTEQSILRTSKGRAVAPRTAHAQYV